MTPSANGPRAPIELPGPRSAELLARFRELFYPGLADGLHPFVAERKSGWTITDVDGNESLDLASASGSVPLGAAREDLIEPAVEAIRRFGNEDSHAVATELMLPLAERLLALAPDSVSLVDIALNGTEAVETAVRMMRRATGRPIVIGFHGSYHGESTTTATLGAEHHEIAAGARALVPGFHHVPYPNPYRSPFAERPGGSGDPVVDYLRDHVLFHVLDPAEVAGVVIEPVLGSGGCIAPSAEFWRALEALCREHGWILCVDEVKSGYGRAGHMLAIERWGVEPELICLGKAMGGGVMPIGAVLGSERAMGGYGDLSTGSTWSWLPGACAAALATLDAFERDGVLDNVAELERVAAQRLSALAERFEEIGEARVTGCFIALEFVTDRETKERATEVQHAVAAAALARGVVADSSTTSLNLQPSLVMPPAELERALDLVADAIEAVSGKAA